MPDVMTAVREFLGRQYPGRGAEVATLAPDAGLFERGLLDSLSFLALITFLEQTFAISVPPRDFTPEVFPTLAGIAAYVTAHSRA